MQTQELCYDPLLSMVASSSLSMSTPHCWAEASFHFEWACAVVCSRTQCGLGTIQTSLNYYADVCVQVSSRMISFTCRLYLFSLVSWVVSSSLYLLCLMNNSFLTSTVFLIVISSLYTFLGRSSVLYQQCDVELSIGL